MANSHETLVSLFTDIANSIRSKTGKSGVIVADNFPSEIDAITAGGNLQEKAVTPTGEQFDVLPEEGYDALSKVTVAGDENLIPGNVKKSITIYGVTGEYEGSGGADREVIPSFYASYVETAKTLYTGEYSGLMILDNGVNTIGVCFLMDDFSVVDYDSGSTWFSMKGAVYCKYTKSTQTWETLDYRTTASTGEHYTNHIKYATRLLYYGDMQIWPPKSGLTTVFCTADHLVTINADLFYMQTKTLEIIYEL